ncbi:hypothetical protein LX73_0875 [Fodinibius salinus]|uniref:Uncharacterized protein n=1 Tax=Fodinibius salinus TaxID=860790 RepID=A0A5D3YN54_9BACT|nr:hypothetical protein LX73_0875 [Fodinibius salinus]
MSFAKTLSRDEMKNIKAGKMDCPTPSCKTTSKYYNCVSRKCREWYSGWDQTECVQTVQSAHKSMIELCGKYYQ